MSAQPLEQFRDAIHAAGLHSPEFITADGRLHRFSSNGTRDDDSGWYVGCWRGGFSKTWRADIGRALTPEETSAQKARMQETQRTRKAEEIKLRAKAREKAVAIWRAAGAAPEGSSLSGQEGRQGSRAARSCR
jgi:putative DNA primase/helicase